MKQRIVLLLFILVAFPCLYGGNDPKSVQAVKLENGEQVVLDGKPDETFWQRCPAAGDFIQNEPQLGQPASFRTRVRVVYNKTHVYFGITCFDPEPGKIVARLSKRESSLQQDDSVVIYLDTFNDGRSAYSFHINMKGVQTDGRLVDNGKTVDITWDGSWKSIGTRTPRGWSGEIAVPLEILKFNPGEDRTWGFGITRYIPRRLEVDTWTGPLEYSRRVSMFGSLKGLDLEKAKRKREIIPHVITRLETGKESETEFGIDARYAISQSLSANLTVNPDFATVEADTEKVNLTRFELSLPEKRNFFLEGAEMYSQRIRLFYSRRIGDVVGGLKVYGKTGKYEFAVLTAQARRNREEGISPANYNVLRFSKNIFESSNIGLLMANKVVDGKIYGSTGLDLVHYFTDKFRLTGQLAMSYGDYSDRNLAFFIRPAFDSSTFHIHLRYTHLGAHFGDNANAVGYIRDDDRQELDSAINKTWWIKSTWLERIRYGSNYNIYWGTDGPLRSWEIEQSLEFDLKNKLSLEIEYVVDFKRYEKDFHNYQFGFELGYNKREWQSANVYLGTGRNEDSDMVLYGAGFNLEISSRTTFEYSLIRLFLDPDPDFESTWIHVFRFQHYFSKDFFFKAFYQTNSVIDKRNIQALLVYRFQPPFGTVQLAYQRGTADLGETGSQRDTLFLKVSYVL